MTELINENSLSLTTDLQLTTFTAVIVPALTLCIAKFIDERKWYCSYTDPVKNI